MTYRVVLRAKLLLLLMLVLVQTSMAADRLAVVVDVSGSMKNYGSWQADARDAIVALLAGRPLPSHWSLDPGGADLGRFSCGPQERVTLLRFGSVQPSAQYPFFAAIQHGLSMEEIGSLFPLSPRDYSENRTNKALAESVAILSATDSNGTAEVIMLSDFYSDANLSDQQIKFINDTEHKFKKDTVATLSWTGNPRVQIKLLRFTLGDALGKNEPPPSLPDGVAQGALHLSPPRFDKSSQNLQLSWSYTGQPLPEKYDIRVTDTRNTTLFSKYGLSSTSVTYPKAASGSIRWAVTAHIPDGKPLEQSATFTVPPGNGPSVWIVVIILAILAAGGAYIWVKRVGLPEILQKSSSSKNTDI